MKASDTPLGAAREVEEAGAVGAGSGGVMPDEPRTFQLDLGEYFGDGRYEDLSDEAAVEKLRQPPHGTSVVRLRRVCGNTFELRAMCERCTCRGRNIYRIRVECITGWTTDREINPRKTPEEAIAMMRAIADEGLTSSVMSRVARDHVD